MRNATYEPLYTIVVGDSPVVATAIHDGHALRDSVRTLVALSESKRLREEDPFTGQWTGFAPTRVIAGRSRFELDLNRSREKAVYLRPEDAWGLSIWRSIPPPQLVEELLQDYDGFYRLLHLVLSQLVARYQRVVVLDLHSYNHRRAGPQHEPADPMAFPDVNVGTGTMNRERWSALVDRFIDELAAFDFPGRRLDVRENICFRGGNMCRWIHEQFPASICSIAVAFKKLIMDEWSATPDEASLVAIRSALASTVPGLLHELRSMTA